MKKTTRNTVLCWTGTMAIIALGGVLIWNGVSGGGFLMVLALQLWESVSCMMGLHPKYGETNHSRQYWGARALVCFLWLLAAVAVILFDLPAFWIIIIVVGAGLAVLGIDWREKQRKKMNDK